MKRVQGYVDVGLAFFIENYKWILTPVVVIGVVAVALYFSGVFGGDSISAEGTDSNASAVTKSEPRPDSSLPAPARAPIAAGGVDRPTPAPTPASGAADEPAAAAEDSKAPDLSGPTPDSLDIVDNYEPEAPVIPARQVRVPISLQGALDLGSLQFELLYEPKTLEFVEVENGTLASSSLVQAHLKAPGRLWLAVVDPYGINGDGDVARVTFQMVAEGRADSPLILERVMSHQASTLAASWPQVTHGIYDLDDSSYVSPVLTYPSQQ